MKFGGNDIDFQQFPIKNLVIHFGTTEPSTPCEAQLFYNTVSKELKYYNGTNWISPNSLPPATTNQTYRFDGTEMSATDVLKTFINKVFVTGNIGSDVALGVENTNSSGNGLSVKINENVNTSTGKLLELLSGNNTKLLVRPDGKIYVDNLKAPTGESRMVTTNSAGLLTISAIPFIPNSNGQFNTFVITGDNATTIWNIEHNYNTYDIIYSAYFAETGESVIVKLIRVDENNVQVDTGNYVLANGVEIAVILLTGTGADNKKVLISDTDTTDGYLFDKIETGDGLELTKTSDAGNEKLLLNHILNLADLLDVELTSLANNEYLKYDSATSKWKNSVINGLLQNGTLENSTLRWNGTDWVENTNVLAADTASYRAVSLKSMAYHYADIYMNGLNTALNTKNAGIRLGADDSYRNRFIQLIATADGHYLNFIIGDVQHSLYLGITTGIVSSNSDCLSWSTSSVKRLGIKADGTIFSNTLTANTPLKANANKEIVSVENGLITYKATYKFTDYNTYRTFYEGDGASSITIIAAPGAGKFINIIKVVDSFVGGLQFDSYMGLRYSGASNNYANLYASIGGGTRIRSCPFNYNIEGSSETYAEVLENAAVVIVPNPVGEHISGTLFTSYTVIVYYTIEDV